MVSAVEIFSDIKSLLAFEASFFEPWVVSTTMFNNTSLRVEKQWESLLLRQAQTSVVRSVPIPLTIYILYFSKVIPTWAFSQGML